MDQNTTNQQIELLSVYRRTLAHLVQQAALFGGETFARPEVAAGLASARSEISRIKEWLRSQGVIVDDKSNDIAPPAPVAPPQGIGIPSVSVNVTTGDNQGTVIGYQQIYNSPTPTAALHQLRAPISDFVGREEEIERLATALRKASIAGASAAISSVRGMGGIGKSELAIKVAHEVKDDFPDGQIVIPMAGASEKPFTAMEALEFVIRSFTAEGNLPSEQSELEARYRSLLTGNRVLILADDAKDEKQIRSLLPPAGSALLVTSRNRFGLPGMVSIDLGVLPEKEAVALLLNLCPRIEEHGPRLAQLCGYLPLALRVSASLLSENDTRDVELYLVQLSDERLKYLKDPGNPDDPQASVEASLRLSFLSINGTEQLALYMLALSPLGVPKRVLTSIVTIIGDVQAIVETLRRRNLVEWQATEQEYHLHDLIWAFAVDRGIDIFQEQVALAHYVGDIQREKAALSYLSKFYDQKGMLREAATYYDRWAKLSGRVGDVESAMGALESLGQVALQQGDVERAIHSFELSRQLADVTNQLDWHYSALYRLESLYEQQGDQHKVIALKQEQLALAQKNEDKKRAANLLMQLAQQYESSEEVDLALDFSMQDLQLREELQDRNFVAIAAARLSRLYERCNEFAKAAEYGQHWLDFIRDTTPDEHQASLESTFIELEERLQRLRSAAQQRDNNSANVEVGDVAVE